METIDLITIKKRWPAILGGDDGIWEKNATEITGNSIKISTGMVGAFGHNAALIKANTVTNNTITIGHDYFRSIADYWSEDHILRNVFNDLGTEESKENKLV